MDTLNIDKKKAINAYQRGNAEQKEVLEQLFGVETFRRKNIMERIKTFNDALIELGPNHPLVKEYEVIYKADNTSSLINYLELRIVTVALNEKWKPRFVKGEKRYYPYFSLYTHKEIGKMLEEEKSRVVFGSGSYAVANSGASFVSADSGSAYMDMSVSPQLAFNTRELAEYAGKQFLKLYADYFLKY